MNPKINADEIISKIRQTTNNKCISGLIYYYEFPDEGLWIDIGGTTIQKEDCKKALLEMLHNSKISQKITKSLGSIRTSFGIIVLAGDNISPVLKSLKLVIK